MQYVWKFRTEDSDLAGSRLYVEVCHSLLLLTELNLLSVTHTPVLYGASRSVWGLQPRGWGWWAVCYCRESSPWASAWCESPVRATWTQGAHWSVKCCWRDMSQSFRVQFYGLPEEGLPQVEYFFVKWKCLYLLIKRTVPPHSTTPTPSSRKSGSQKFK